MEVRLPCGNKPAKIPECKGGDCDLGEKAITENGTYTASDDGYDGYSEVTVDVSGGGYPEPTGTKTITENGTGIDVKDYALADVNVPNSYSAGDEGKVVSNGALVAQGSQTITQNGTYDTTLISELVANVSGGGGSTNILSGTDIPASSVGENGAVYLLLAESQDFTQLSLKKEYSMSAVQYENSVVFSYGSGENIGAQVYRQIDLTDINTIACHAKAFNGQYATAYSTQKFSPILLIENTVNPAQAFPINTSIVSANGETYRLESNSDEQTFVADVSELTGNYWVVLSCAGCTATFSELYYSGNTTIGKAYLKVEGAWQNLIGSDINDVNTGE